MLVVAGAGSGKTETMAARVVWLVVNGLVAAEDVLGLTFTRKAAGELGERIRARLRALQGLGVVAPSAPVTVSTYNSYAAGLLRDHGLRIGLEPGARLLGEAAAWQIVDELVERWPEPMTELEAARATAVEAVVGLAAECSDHLVEPASVQEVYASTIARLLSLPASVGDPAPAAPSAPVREVLERLAAKERLVPLVEAYRSRKAELGLLDFGDQVALAARVARENPSVVEAERDRFKVVLLDEYQDTSHAQEVLLRTLFGAGHHVAAVGDPFQSIYGWRGASSGNLARFCEAFARADSMQVCPLSTSWRNDSAILDVAQALSQPLRATERQVVRLTPRAGSGPGRVEVHWHATVEDEARAVAEFALRTMAAHTVRPSMAVLCRTRSQFPFVEAALRAKGLPVEVVGLGGLLHVPEVADLRAALEVVHDPARGDALMRILTGPVVDLGPRDLDALGAWGSALSARESMDERCVVEALDTLPPLDWRGAEGQHLSVSGRGRLERLCVVLRSLRSRSGAPLVELVADVERALFLDVEVAARPGMSQASARAHLDAFGDVAAGFADQRDGPSLGAFLRWLDVAADRERGLDAGAAEPRPDAIQIATVHAAKGLEWDAVAVVGLVEGTFPDGTGGKVVPVSKGWLGGYGNLPYPLRGDGADLPRLELSSLTSQPQATVSLRAFTEACGLHDLAEERRLAYVAVTRARSALMLSGSLWGDGSRPRVPSRFLIEAREVATTLEGTWVAEAGQDDVNPREERQARIAWPVDLLGDRRAAVEAGAALVRAAAEEPPGQAGASGAWDDEIDLLLAERAALEHPVTRIALPAHLSVSRMVALAEDPAGLAAQLRRPLPVRPTAGARRGSAFHAWLEQRFASAALVDIDDLPGAVDDELAADDDLDALRDRFLASEWAARTPIAVEVAVETPVAGLVLRGRIDAVFLTETPQGPRWDVVDWKTGEPAGRAAADARAVQLAVYRLAWARLQGIPVEHVEAAFFYASTGRTVRPVDLIDAEGLERVIRSATQDAPGHPSS